METTRAAAWLTSALWLLSATTRSCSGSCSNGTNIAFSVINTRNSAAQWTTEVRLDNEKEVNAGKGRWNVKIDQINSFQCAGTVHFTASLTVPAPRNIPGYDYLPGVGYYKMHGPARGVVWEEARRTCVREGGHLAIINSELESTMLQLMFAKTSSRKPYAFIGFHDHYEEGKYLTVYDVPLEKTGFNRWQLGQPDNVGHGGENCGSIARDDGSLNDINCFFDDWPFICEQEL